jgi:uncharacterized OB-fold protein
VAGQPALGLTGTPQAEPWVTTASTESPGATFAAHLKRGQLAYQETADGRALFYPRLVAQADHSAPLNWRVSKGLGVVYAVTVIHDGDGLTRNVALIELDEGFRVMSRVVGVADCEVRIGARVSISFERGEPSSARTYVFVPSDA